MSDRYTNRPGYPRVILAMIGAAMIIVGVIVFLAIALPVLCIVLGIREGLYILGRRVRQAWRQTT